MQAVSREPWTLQRAIPVSFILAVLVQTGTAVWWGSGISAKIDEHSRAIATLQAAEAERKRDERQLYERLGSLNSNVSEMRRAVERIENTLATTPR